MKNRWSKLLIFVFILCMTAGMALPAGAEELAEEEPNVTLQIRSPEEFFQFAKLCRMDSYSCNLLVNLETDLDLSETEFSGVPIFCGTFEGNNHHITGFTCTKDGSSQGLFRYLSQDAVVRNLTVEGTVLPEGSKTEIGGLAGSNGGTIENCSFTGEVGGSNVIGGLVGVNLETGVLRGCQSGGQVHGDHFVGGLAGENRGLIETCTNLAQVNTVARQNDVELSDITMEAMIKTETAVAVTDVGGVAGQNTGVIFQSENQASVGYPHMGYNVGGITGSQRGYLRGCINNGAIFGRKEVGGITGQMEPVNRIAFTVDTLQTLQQQLSNLTGLTSQASANAQNSAAAMDEDLVVLREQSAMALEAVTWLLPDPFDPGLPELEDLWVAHNVISGSIGTIHQTMDSMAQSTKDTIGQLSRDMQAIAYQVSAMSQTISDAPAQLGGTITDVSDTDTEEDVTGKIENCWNYGPVDGDLNVGGIAGAVDWENDLDPEKDYQLQGERSLNFDSELRAVILDCHNRAQITVKKQSAGGITGRMALGLVKNCSNTGTIRGEHASLLGGIAGNSVGYLRCNSSKCELWGEANVGGIAGSASVATDCRSVVRLHGGKEKLGAILGFRETDYKELDTPVKGNLYLLLEDDPGGIDGISYEAVAEPCSAEEFRVLPDLPDSFRSTTVTFLKEDDILRQTVVVTGEGLAQSRIPEVPPKEGYTGEWKGLSETDLSNIYFDLNFEPLYTPYLTTISSTQKRSNDMPVLLAEGAFAPEAQLKLEPLTDVPDLSEEETFLEGWTCAVAAESDDLQLRYAWPGRDLDRIRMLLQDQNGGWTAAETEKSGSYLVFSAPPSIKAFCAVELPEDHTEQYALIGAGGIVILTVAVTLLLKRRKKHRRKKGGPDGPNA